MNHTDTDTGGAALCYVDGWWAYFTTQPLSKQRGDDWNDAPYEHNAGVPYEADGTQKHQIIKMAYDGEFIEPNEEYLNSPYSVEMINNGVVPWLRGYDALGNPISIMAGATTEEFRTLILQGGGQVYMTTAMLKAREAGE